MITILLILGGVIVLASVYFVLASLSHAPEGYEDDRGFHVKAETPIAQVAVVEAARRSTRSPQRSQEHLPAAPVAAH